MLLTRQSHHGPAGLLIPMLLLLVVHQAALLSTAKQPTVLSLPHQSNGSRNAGMGTLVGPGGTKTEESLRSVRLSESSNTESGNTLFKYKGTLLLAYALMDT